MLAEVQELYRDGTAEAYSTLREIMLDKKQDARARVAAANAIMDRAWGKPAQTLNVDAKPQMPQVVRIITPMTRKLLEQQKAEKR